MFHNHKQNFIAHNPKELTIRKIFNFMCYNMAKLRTLENSKVFAVPIKKLIGFSLMTVNVTGDRRNMQFAWTAVAIV